MKPAKSSIGKVKSRCRIVGVRVGFVDKDELVDEIVALLMDDSEIASHAWDQLSIVAQVMEGSIEASGFAYQENGKAIPTGPANFDFLTKVEQLQQLMREPDKEPWKALLMRVDNHSGQYSIAFEYDHPEKWSITPANVKGMADTLRSVNHSGPQNSD